MGVVVSQDGHVLSLLRQPLLLSFIFIELAWYFVGWQLCLCCVSVFTSIFTPVSQLFLPQSCHNVLTMRLLASPATALRTTMKIIVMIRPEIGTKAKIYSRTDIISDSRNFKGLSTVATVPDHQSNKTCQRWETFQYLIILQYTGIESHVRNIRLNNV